MPLEDQLDTELQDFKLSITSDDVLHMLKTVAPNPITKTSSSSVARNATTANYQEVSDNDSDEAPLKNTRSTKNTKEDVSTARGRGRATRGRAARGGAATTTPSKNATRTGATANSGRSKAVEVSPSTVSLF